MWIGVSPNSERFLESFKLGHDNALLFLIQAVSMNKTGLSVITMACNAMKTMC
jgi:hypothetical protein